MPGRGVVPLLCSAGLHAALGAWLVAVSGAGGLRPLVVDLTVPEPPPVAAPAPPPAPARERERGAARALRPVAAAPRAAPSAPEARPRAEPHTAPPAVETRPEPEPVPSPPVLSPPAVAPAPPQAFAPSVTLAPESPARAAADAPRGTPAGAGHSAGAPSTPSSGPGPGTGPPVALATPSPGPGGGSGEYGRYLARFRSAVQAELRYPLSARRRGLAGSVELEVVIAPDGRVTGVTVVSSSSHDVLDEAATGAVRRLSPLPFPAHLPPRPLIVRLPLVFDLR